MERVSIITITRNDGALLDRAVRSVREQSARRQIEHIVVDGSDRTPGDIEGVTMIHTAPRGVYAALNEGIRHCSGEIIGMVHGNDFFASEAVVRKVLDIFEAEPELDFVFANLLYTDPVTGKERRFYNSSRFEPGLLERGFGPAHPTLFARRRVFERVGLYDESFRVAGDFEMWLRLFDAKAGLRWRCEPVVTHVMSTGGISSRLKNQLTVNLQEKRRALRMHSRRASWWRLLERFLYL